MSIDNEIKELEAKLAELKNRKLMNLQFLIKLVILKSLLKMMNVILFLLVKPFKNCLTFGLRK